MNNPAASYGVSSVLSYSNAQQAAGNITQEKFKLHMIINDTGQIISIKITKGNVDDRIPVAELTKKLKGSIYSDKGYIGADLFKDLYKRGLTRIFHKASKIYSLKRDNKQL